MIYFKLFIRRKFKKCLLPLLARRSLIFLVIILIVHFIFNQKYPQLFFKRFRGFIFTSQTSPCSSMILRNLVFMNHQPTLMNLALLIGCEKLVRACNRQNTKIKFKNQTFDLKFRRTIRKKFRIERFFHLSNFERDFLQEHFQRPFSRDIFQRHFSAVYENNCYIFCDVKIFIYNKLVRQGFCKCSIAECYQKPV